MNTAISNRNTGNLEATRRLIVGLGGLLVVGSFTIAYVLTSVLG